MIVTIEVAAEASGPRMVADLGTGSGAIGLSMAKELPIADTTVWITDMSEDALAVARANLAGIGRAASNVRVGAGSWFDALPEQEFFDVVVSNPPYVAEGSPMLDALVREWEPARALFAGADGLDDIRVLVSGASAHLRPDGWLVLEIGADQGRVVSGLFGDHGFVDVEIRSDLAGRDRVVLGRTP